MSSDAGGIPAKDLGQALVALNAIQDDNFTGHRIGVIKDAVIALGAHVMAIEKFLDEDGEAEKPS